MVKQELQHEEVWDDSALVNSWNEALDEYKKYHSLAAKGEKVDITPENAVENAPQDTVVQGVEEADLRQQNQINGHATPQQPAAVVTEAPHASFAPQALPQTLLNNGELIVP